MGFRMVDHSREKCRVLRAGGGSAIPVSALSRSKLLLPGCATFRSVGMNENLVLLSRICNLNT